MKKILFLLVLIYNFSFADDRSSFLSYLSLHSCSSSSYVVENQNFNNNVPCTGDGSRSVNKIILYSSIQNLTQKCISSSWVTVSSSGTNFSSCVPRATPLENPSLCPSQTIIKNGKLYKCNQDNGDYVPQPNPDPLGGPQCRDLFQKDGTAYTCNPNTNEATPIPNSNGTILDPESPNGNDKPNCSAGYEAVGTMTVAGGGNSSYNNWSCVASTPTPPNGETGNTGNTGEPSISYGGDGSTTMTLPDGTKQTTYGDGWVTTTYPDGTTSSTAPHSSGGGGTSGGGGGSSGSGTTGNTTNENNTTPTEDTPIDNTPVANSCSDSTLTLQEKMLCELNAGMKKQNSEGNPSNSLNQLLKDLKTSNQTDNTAINTNLKDIEAGTVQLVNKQTQANATLEKINNSANATELYTKSMNDGINKISKQLEADPNTPDSGNPLSGSGNIIDSLASTFTEFKDNMKNQGDTLGNLIDSANNTVNQGFTLTVNNSNLQACPKSYILDLSSMGLTNQTVIVDICYVASMLKPFLYPIFLILMTISLTFFTFKMIGVLL